MTQKIKVMQFIFISKYVIVASYFLHVHKKYDFFSPTYLMYKYGMEVAKQLIMSPNDANKPPTMVTAR